MQEGDGHQDTPLVSPLYAAIYKIHVQKARFGNGANGVVGREKGAPQK